MCDCKSYNRPDWGGSTPEVVMPYRSYFPHSGKATACIDSCIVAQMTALWEAGIETGGCCCGHNRRPAPEVMLQRPADVERACQILSEIDDREWHVTVWSKVPAA